MFIDLLFFFMYIVFVSMILERREKRFFVGVDFCLVCMSNVSIDWEVLIFF